jgi:YVTN family beta-propeller protein
MNPLKWRVTVGLFGVVLVAAAWGGGSSTGTSRKPKAATNVAPPPASTVYVVNTGSDDVTPINTATNTAGTPIGGPGAPFAEPRDIAITPDGKTAYVTSAGTLTKYPCEVVPINTATNTVGTPIVIGQGNGFDAWDIAITPDGKTAYVTNDDAGNVIPINTATGTAGSPIRVGDGPRGIAITPDGKTAYVTNFGSPQADGNTVTPINTATNTAGTPIRVGTGPQGIAITPNGKTAYVSDFRSNTVTPINTATNTAGTPIRLPRNPAVLGGPVGIAITPDGKTAYVANYGAEGQHGDVPGTVSPINTATNTAGTPIALGLGASPNAVVITPDGKTAYVANTGSNTVTPINTATNAAGTPIGVDHGPYHADPVAIAITP